MPYIYKIINDVNNKIYIGKTSRDLETRMNEHIRDSFNPTQGSKIHFAMKKYGVEHFSMELLEECPESELNVKERYWIQRYDSQINGYNNTSGGDGRSLNDTQIEAIRSLWEQGFSCAEISEKLNLSHSTVYHRITLYSDYDNEQEKIKAYAHISKKVKQYSLKGEYIQTFNSLREASRAVTNGNNADSNIAMACKQHTISHGYYWTFEDETLNMKLPKGQRRVLQYDLQGNLIDTYISARAAAKAININSSCVIRACNGQSKTCKGYIFKYEN